jgi:multiple sugar transport system substrate-binding protein
MRAHAIVFAAALLMLPLGARGADLVVWWEKGYYPQEDEAVREIIAAFEQASGNSKLLEQPFWLDASDPHRMAAVMQVASRPLVHNYAVASGNWRHEIVEQE